MGNTLGTAKEKKTYTMKYIVVELRENNSYFCFVTAASNRETALRNINKEIKSTPNLKGYKIIELDEKDFSNGIINYPREILRKEL